nr:hypothetical protein [uncultured Pseudomonas sp.]
MKYAVLLLALYATVLTVFLIAYFLPIREALGRVAKTLNFAQRFILVFAFSTIIVVVGVFLLLLIFNVKVNTDIGQVGDFVGGILNPVLSFLALIAIVISISIQERELSSSVDSLRSQEKIFKAQNFENSLFNIMTMQRNRRSEQIEHTKDGVKSSYFCFLERLHTYRREADEDSLSPLRAHFAASKFIKKEGQVNSAMILLAQFIMIDKFIHSAGLDPEQEKNYMQLAYSDLNIYEAAVLNNVSLKSVKLRKKLRKYNLPNIKHEFYASPLMGDYFSGEKKQPQPTDA